MRKFIKILLWLFLAMFVGLVIFSVFSPSKDESESQKTEIKIDVKAKLDSLMKDEPSVKDFTFIEGTNILYVSVLDDGTIRTGLAEYFCTLMRENKISVNRVKIVKFNSFNDPNRDNAYGVLLGESWCNK